MPAGGKSGSSRRAHNHPVRQMQGKALGAYKFLNMFFQTDRSERLAEPRHQPEKAFAVEADSAWRIQLSYPI